MYFLMSSYEKLFLYIELILANIISIYIYVYKLYNTYYKHSHKNYKFLNQIKLRTHYFLQLIYSSMYLFVYLFLFNI